MLLIFCANATSRVHYVLKQVFTHSLGIEYGVTDVLDAFIAHAGPKMSYGKKPLGNEFFVQSSSLLFEQGIREQPVEVKTWQGHCCFFLTGQQSKIPFDIFAATFISLAVTRNICHTSKTNTADFYPSRVLLQRTIFSKNPWWIFGYRHSMNYYKKRFPISPLLQKPRRNSCLWWRSFLLSSTPISRYLEMLSNGFALSTDSTFGRSWNSYWY